MENIKWPTTLIRATGSLTDWRDGKHRMHCGFCDKRITNILTGWLELYGRKLDGSAMKYPSILSSPGWKPVAVLSHTDCGPDCGYAIQLYRLTENWEEHLKEKTWYWSEIPLILETVSTLMWEAGAQIPKPHKTVV
jgi:hypothetical protein